MALPSPGGAAGIVAPMPGARQAGRMRFSDISHWARSNGLEIILIGIGAVLIARFAHWASARYQAKVERDVLDAVARGGVASEQSKRARALAQAIGIGVAAVDYFVAGLLILSKFGLPLTSLVAPATVAGVAIGFGAQQIVADVLSGFFLFAERQFGVGDLVQLAQPGQTTGITGTVEELTLRITKIRSAQGELVFLPNGALRQVTNLSKEWSRVVIDIPVPVGQDLNRATELIRNTGAAMAEDGQWRDVLLGRPVVAGVENIEVGYLMLRVVARTLPGRQFDVGRELRLRIALALQEAGITAPPGIVSQADPAARS
jgi:moderate conductance mechanosensitive channel